MAAGQRLKIADLFRKVPTDLTEATSIGGALSICAALFMLILFFVELSAFLTHRTETMVVLDPGLEQQIRINFNVTMLDLPCRFAVVDVLDVLGTNRMNVSKNIEKWNLDENGRRRFFQGRNREERDITHDEHHPELEVLLQNGEHAIPLNSENFNDYLKANEYTFANFYAPWCVWCQRLHPTWEAFAENMEEEKIPVKVVKVDCVANDALCRDQKIHAFPTLRLFRYDAALPPDYQTDRTVRALNSYVTRKLNVEEKRKSWPDKDKEYKEHPGCMLSGHLLVNRVPGNFHIEARSKAHNLNAAMTNLSHIVNHLSFGPPVEKDVIKRLERFSSGFYDHVSNALDGRVFILDEFHKAYHHYIKVVGTMYEMPNSWGKNELVTYQMLPESSVMSYAEEDVPEARFNYDVSPMSVIVKKTGRRWYEFVTSLCGIIGGTYQVVGLIDSALYRAIKGGKKL